MSKDHGHSDSKADVQGSRMRAQEEQHRLEMAAISVISLCNTKESLDKQKLDKTNPYYTTAYGDVVETVEREIKAMELLKESSDLFEEIISLDFTNYTERKMLALIEKIGERI